MRRLHFSVLISVGMFWMSCSPSLPEDVAAAYDELPDKLNYNIHIKPILSDKCFACHGPDEAKQEAGLRLDIAEQAYAELPENPGKFAIKPGKLSKSEVFHRILSEDPGLMMPTPESHLSLSASEKAMLVKWINDGAVYQPHWAFVKPQLPEIPKLTTKGVTLQNPIDNFIISRLEKEGMLPSAEAPRDVLLRRLYFDLTGLPPTVEELDRFLGDSSADAYEKQVDRLLQSPHYGEKMAADWLDVARFADTHGYTVDRLRDMSPYRDWVIRALNDNLPYDQFIHWQLAGDQMPDPSRDMLIATAFNRNHPQNMEGGIINEEFRVEYVADRTNTLGDAFLGLSVSCARCHDHKYDPISQKNYFQLFSFFNQVKEAGQISWDNAMPSPTLLLPDEQKEKMLEWMKNNVSAQEKKTEQVKAEARPQFEKWLRSEQYRRELSATPNTNGLAARYTFENENAVNLVSGKSNVLMLVGDGSKGGSLKFTEGQSGKAVHLNGDEWMHFNDIGNFRKSDPFTISLWVNIPKALKEGVILHNGYGGAHYQYRGYHLYLKDDQLELNMAHSAPSDAITRISAPGIPREKWINLTVSYDGSGKAAGLNLYLDGELQQMETVMDNLTKDIFLYDKRFSNVVNNISLQIGGWSRGLGFVDGKVDDVLVYARELTPFEIKVNAGKARWQDIIRQAPGQLQEEEKKQLQDYYVSAVHPELQNARKELHRLRTALADSMEFVPEIMIMRDLGPTRQTHLLQRGVYDAPGEEVSPATPESILPMPEELPRNRYGLAQWLTHPDNPLTARVAVNRIWQNIFGTGFVKTAEDFGNQGEMPSHLELLDWLAIQFQESGWDVKKLVKTIVMSATYRQNSEASDKAREADPANRLLSHGPSVRLSAEMIRDNALAASGLLNRQIGGKSVKPYQPEGLWSINSAHYEQDTGSAVYRRSLYVVIKRSVLHPTLATFDASSRSVCIVRRQQTNTPLQALVTLNDPAFVEVAAVMGQQMAGIQDPAAAIRSAYRKLTSRQPGPEEVELLLELYKKEQEKFRQAPRKMKGWLQAGQFAFDPANPNASSVAAHAVVASTILNSDATLTKR